MGNPAGAGTQPLLLLVVPEGPEVQETPGAERRRGSQLRGHSREPRRCARVPSVSDNDDELRAQIERRGLVRDVAWDRSRVAEALAAWSIGVPSADAATARVGDALRPRSAGTAPGIPDPSGASAA